MRILVVDDFQPFREFVCAALRRAGFAVIDEAVDGLEAVHKAKALQPDLILLDIGLPRQNGLVAARQLRLVAAGAKIVFVSQEMHPQIVRETFSLGAHGYVHKPQTGRDLLIAIDAVLSGKSFISSGLEHKEGARAHPRHIVQFYSNDDVFVESVTPFVGSALKTGDAAVVLATKPHREALAHRLKDEGFQIDAAIEQGTYLSRDAGETLSHIMVNGHPDRARFLTGLNGLVESALAAATATHPRVVIFGECVGLLCEAHNAAAAIQLEKTGNDMLRTLDADIMCAYPLGAFYGGEEDDRAFNSICAEHTVVYAR